MQSISLSAAEKMTRPVLVSPSPSSVLEIRDGQHPCLIYSHSGGEYIPNDVRIEGPRKVVLVTGPNMGGKSTLMRQTGLLVVLAQLVRVLLHDNYCAGVSVIISGAFRVVMFQLLSAS